jgi:phospholipid/cholesterol/gamma-HCH transport system substrate-binding protein
VLVLAGISLAVATRHGAGSYRVTAVFGDVRGLVSGADVRAGGVRVGRVESIRLDGDGWPRVRLAISRSYPMHAGATAAVRVASLSSEWNDYVSVTSGAGAALRDGAVLGPRSTSSPVQVDEALQALGPRTRGDLRAVLAAVNAGMTGRGRDIARTLASAGGVLRQTAGLAGDVGADGAALRTLVSDTSKVSAALAARPSSLGGAVDSTAALLHVTAARERALRGTLAALPDALGQARGALASGRSAVSPLRALIRAADPGLPQVAPTARQLVPVLRNARPALASAARLVRTAPADLRALAPLLRDARPVLSELAPVLSEAGPMLDQARVRLPDAFSFFANWADFTSNYDANGHAARVGIVLPPASTRTLAPDSDSAGQLKAPYLRTPGSLEGQPWEDYKQSFVGGGG